MTQLTMTGDDWASDRDRRALATPPDALDALRRLVAAIIDDDGDDDDENAPGHAHGVPGVWDDDNHPSIAGVPCELCAAWRNARAVLAAHDEYARPGDNE